MKVAKNPLSDFQQDAQSQVMSVAIAIPLAQNGFGAIVFALHKPITQPRRQKSKEGQDFISPVAKGRSGLAQFCWPVAFDVGDPSIQAAGRRSGRRSGIPGAQVFLELPSARDLRKREG